MRALEHALSTPLRPRLNAIMTRWHWLIETVSDPYRPELHYMRGPAQSGARSIKVIPKVVRLGAAP